MGLLLFLAPIARQGFAHKGVHLPNQVSFWRGLVRFEEKYSFWVGRGLARIRRRWRLRFSWQAQHFGLWNSTLTLLKTWRQHPAQHAGQHLDNTHRLGSTFFVQSSDNRAKLTITISPPKGHVYHFLRHACRHPFLPCDMHSEGRDTPCKDPTQGDTSRKRERERQNGTEGEGEEKAGGRHQPKEIARWLRMAP